MKRFLIIFKYKKGTLSDEWENLQYIPFHRNFTNVGGRMNARFQNVEWNGMFENYLLTILGQTRLDFVLNCFLRVCMAVSVWLRLHLSAVNHLEFSWLSQFLFSRFFICMHAYYHILSSIGAFGFKINIFFPYERFAVYIIEKLGIVMIT